MAFSKIHFNDTLPHGALLRRALNQLETGHDLLNDAVEVITLMIDGDGSQASHFGEVMTRFATPDLATAKAMYDELQSLRFKLNTNAQVDSVLAAFNQAFAKLR